MNTLNRASNRQNGRAASDRRGENYSAAPLRHICRGDDFPELVQIVALVRQNFLASKALDQRFGLTDIVDLAFRQNKAQRISERIHGHIDLGA